MNGIATRECAFGDDRLPKKSIQSKVVICQMDQDAAASNPLRCSGIMPADEFL